MSKKSGGQEKFRLELDKQLGLDPFDSARAKQAELSPKKPRTPSHTSSLSSRSPSHIPLESLRRAPMASPSSPRLLSTLLADRLGALSARPLLRAGSPARGHRRVTCQATRTLSNLVDALFSRRDNGEYCCIGLFLLIVSIVCRSLGGLRLKYQKLICSYLQPGITTDEIDKAVHKMIIDNGAYPSPLGYCGFPKSVCTSVNECICHGIPDSCPLEDGDIINIDVTVYLNGYHGDTSATFLCGDVDDEAKKLVQVTKESLDKAISICAPGVEINRIGRTIQDHADKFKYGVVQQFVGHGVGKVFHAEPAVLHYRNNERGRMMLNQTFTIEPMLTIGSTNATIWSDDWTAVTEDGSLSAQFEHTLLITEDGVEILTQC
ncbi:hypothetical protein ACQ4PT_003112 [Festuca glaucescens]